MSNQSRYSIDLNRIQQFTKCVGRLKKNKSFPIDDVVKQFHHDVFHQINCLECANCCRSLGPRLSDMDISRISAYLRIKPSVFTQKYLKIDEDNDYVFHTLPCPFLDSDNYCRIYPARPSACRDYPHTSRSNIKAVLNILLKDAKICPAVFTILDRLCNESTKR